MEKTDTLNLLICGAQRSGTTSLKHYLEEHPEISFLGENDLYYEGKYVSYPFCTPFYSKASIGEDPDVYREISKKHCGKAAYIGTKWPYFMLFPHIACNIRLHLPDAKLLFILRNPVDALYSSYWHAKSKNGSPYSFDERIERALSLAETLWTPQNRGQWPKLLAETDNDCWWLERGCYYQQIVNFYNLFRPEQILVLQFEEMIHTPSDAMKRVLGFLGLDQSFSFKGLGKKMNASPPYQPMSPETRKKLAGFYADSNRKLCGLLGWPEGLWK